MTDEFQWERTDPPDIPEDELESFNHVRMNYHALRECVDDLEAAVLLYEHSQALTAAPEPDWRARMQRNAPLLRWMNIAARSGAIAIYEYYRVQQAMDALINGSPTMTMLIADDQRRASTKLFIRSFPDFTALRTIAAHGREMIDTPDKERKHRAEKGVGAQGIDTSGPTLLHGTLINGRYTSTHDGKLIAYEVGHPTVGHLREVYQLRRRAIAAFGFHG